MTNVVLQQRFSMLAPFHTICDDEFPSYMYIEGSSQCKSAYRAWVTSGGPLEEPHMKHYQAYSKQGRNANIKPTQPQSKELSCHWQPVKGLERA